MTDPLDPSSPERLRYEAGLDPWRTDPLTVPTESRLDDEALGLAVAVTLWSLACVGCGLLVGAAGVLL